MSTSAMIPLSIAKALDEDPFLAWVRPGDLEIEAVKFRLACKHGIGAPPQSEEVYDEEPGWGYFIFSDGSLYGFSEGDPIIWANVNDFASEYANEITCPMERIFLGLD